MSDLWPVAHLQGPRSPNRPSSSTSRSTAHVSYTDSRASVISGWTVSGESAEGRIHYSQFPVPPLDLPARPLINTSSTSSSPTTPTSFNFRFTPRQLVGTRTPTRTPSPTARSRAESPSGVIPIVVRKLDVVSSKDSGSAPAVPAKALLATPSQSNMRSHELNCLEVPNTHAVMQVERVPSRRASSPLGPEEWNDGASVISVNPSEENILSTSFISSLLTQGLNNAPSGGPPTAWGRHRYLGPTAVSDAQTLSNGGTPSIASSPQPPDTASTSSSGADSADHRTLRMPQSSMYAPSEQSRASNAPSTPSVYSPLPPAGSQTTTKSSPTFTNGGDSSTYDSRRGSDEYSETMHSDEVSPVVRTASITLSARPIGVTQARTIQQQPQKPKPNLTISSDSSRSRIIATTPPPGHHADAPQSVTGHTEFTHGCGETEPDMHDAYHRKTNSFDSTTPISPALPSTANSHGRFVRGDNMGDSDSSSRYVRRNQSLRSVVSSLASRVSRASRASRASMSSSLRQAKYLAWLRVRPLPPLPIVPIPRPPHVFSNADEIQKYEEQIPLPVLAKRAGALENKLEGDRFTTRSARASSRFNEGRNDGVYIIETISPKPEGGFSTGQRTSQFPRDRRSRHKIESVHGWNSPSPTREKRRSIADAKMRKIWIVVGISLATILLVIVLPVWLTRKRGEDGQLACIGNMTGRNCDIDATCTCASTTGQCHPLAQGILSLIPDVNAIFTTNFTPTTVSSAIFNAQGNSADKTCTQQAVLIDTAPGLDSDVSPSRTKWARAALLWNLVLSEDTRATNALQTFILRTDWSVLTPQDGVAEDNSGRFRTIQSGYLFDFAAQTVNAINKTFTDNWRITEAQAARVSYVSGNALNRMFSIASSSSTQSQKSFQTFWRSVLQQQPEDLPSFLDAVRTSPFLIPFNAADAPGGQALTSLMTPPNLAQFPVPLSCYPSLSSQQLQQIGILESNVFGLTSPLARESFDASCHPDRPTYGVVNLLRLRLPFPDDRVGASRQASQLSTDALPRSVLYCGEIASGIPGARSIPEPTSLDPSQFGTTDNLSRVLLTYLSSISDVSLAMELVQFILSRSPVPPTSSSRLISSLSDIPILEFAIFGSVTPQDIVASYSSFTAPNGTLFFGSGAAQSFREWATFNPSSSIVWTTNGTSEQIARETGARNSAFESVWDDAAQSAGSTDPTVVQELVKSLSEQGLLTRN